MSELEQAREKLAEGKAKFEELRAQAFDAAAAVEELEAERGNLLLAGETKALAQNQAQLSRAQAAADDALLMEAAQEALVDGHAAALRSLELAAARDELSRLEGEREAVYAALELARENIKAAERAEHEADKKRFAYSSRLDHARARVRELEAA